MKPSLVFDLDGTLVDTAPDLLRVTEAVTAKYGVEKIAQDDLRNLVGYGARYLITKALGDRCIILDKSEIDRAVTEFLQLYSENIAQLSKPFDGVLETLSSLRRDGYPMFVATNKPGALARQLLDALEMTRFFARIMGGDDVPAKKPAANHIFAACGHRGERPIVMIGDAPPDVGAGRAAGAAVIAMSYGYCPVAVETLRADVILTSFRQLPSALENLERANALSA